MPFAKSRAVNARNASALKAELDRLYRENNTKKFIEADPVQFPHRYKNRYDREIAAFLAATIAWGRRDLILKSAEKMFTILGPSPYAFVMEGKYRALKTRVQETRTREHASGPQPQPSPRGRCIHRTFFEDDLLCFCRGLRACYAKYGSLENLFASAPDMWGGISLFRETMASSFMTPPFKAPVMPAAYSRHVANPAAGSACKRINLALRWLVRREGPVDLGQWKSISPAALFIPLDVHVGRTARRVGLLDRKTNDQKAVISLTEKLREFCPEDPVKYDLALFGFSV